MNPQDLHLPQQQPHASTSQLERSTSTSSQAPPLANSDPNKSKKELEQEQRDLELSQLLEQMDEYKPIVSSRSSLHLFRLLLKASFVFLRSRTK